jgi:lipopolysaccharide export LptBFGC system permease protein LptF
MLWFEDSVMPDANHRRYEINEPKGENDEGGDPAERFNYIYTASDGSVVYFDFYSGHRKTGQGVTLLVQPKHGSLAVRIDAKTMLWDKGWKLKDGTRRTFLKAPASGPGAASGPGGVDAFTFKELALTEFKDQPKDLLDDRVYPEEMGTKEIERRIAILKRSGESARALETQKHFRWSSSLVSLFMAIIGAAMSVHTIKTGLARNFGIALLITFLYYVALRLGLVMGENGSLSPVMGAWFGNFLFAPLGFFLLWRAARI